MATPRTEDRHEEAVGFDTCAPLEILDILARAQLAAAGSVSGALADIADAARLAADCLAAGGRLAYAGAGSSGLMAMADALELPGTYGIPRDRIAILIAGGTSVLETLAGGAEDDEAQAEADVVSAGLGAGDCLVAVTASGSTPYAVAAVRAAAGRGAHTVAMANNRQAAIFAGADVAIHLATPPEVVAGSTRMGAGTAQKIALNMFSTLVAVHLGHVHDGYMVNLTADNRKLRGRAARIVAAIAGCGQDEADRFLEEADGSVKAAVLLAAGAADADAASRLLDQSGRKLRPALAMIEERRSSGRKSA